MKINANNLNQNQDQLNEQQLNELENDAVWSLLRETEKNSATEASPMFARNVMREIRLNHPPKTSQSLWNRLITPRFNKLVIGLGVTAAFALIVISQMPGQDTSSDSVTITKAPIDEFDELSDILIEDELDEFTDEMIEIVNQDPFFLSEEEIEIAMQM